MKTLKPAVSAGIRRAIKEQRLAAGLSQHQLAARMGISPPAVSHWEGHRAPGLPTLIALAGLFGCGLDDLVPVKGGGR